ncbi:MAG: bifunctional adenosylcobinamide kinase/adenosylcobinamide-phosphate guanylyltransferase [Desulfobacula sp.]|nr:bifunctional adenosylcobinamide kinase/adenosylcobinamide-phosphate guanylyltransferase [Desulfobacula sp.]
MKHEVTFVIGGCRSGKSSYALNQADKIAGKNKYFIATSVPTDMEMEERVHTHQKERGEDWNTIEEPVLIQKTISRLSQHADVILVDCLTLWLSNLMLASTSKKDLEIAVSHLEDALKKSVCPIFLVSNEVGFGIVPENKLARKFRDFAGLVNQRVAATADRVVITVAGIDVQIKPRGIV